MGIGLPGNILAKKVAIRYVLASCNYLTGLLLYLASNLHHLAMMHFLDTNIYRNLVREVDISDIQTLAERIRKAESEQDITTGIPIVVAMELIRHLDPTDPNCQECFKALCLLFDHTKNFDAQRNTFHGTFFPPLNVILPKYFFDENGPFLEIYKVIISLTRDLTDHHDIGNIERFQQQINTVGEQLLFEKQEIYDNMTQYLREQNNGTLDWAFFAKNKKEREALFRSLRKGTAINDIAEGFMQRAFSIAEKKYERNDENWGKFLDFYEHYYPAIAMSSLLITQIGHGTTALSDITDHRWNTVSDISMMFGALYNADIKEIVFITEEKKMHEFFALNSMDKHIDNLQGFKARLGI